MERYFGFAKELLIKGLAKEEDSYGEDNLYDVNITDTSDFGFYLSLAKQCNGKVLDVGCGTGRVLRELLKAGYDAVGVDLSEEMLAVAKLKLTEAGFNPLLIQGDMRNLQIDDKFALTIIPNCSMIYINNDEDRKRVFKSVSNSLQKGGLFAFDFDAEEVPLDETKPWLSAQTVNRNSGEVVISTVQMKGIHNQLRLINMVNYRYNSENNCRITVNASFEATCKYARMIELLEATGFHVKGIYSDYQLTPYQGEELCVVVAEKL
jgi:SAM-dependent methyltransferase